MDAEGSRFGKTLTRSDGVVNAPGEIKGVI
jgi:hypothetical protein